MKQNERNFWLDSSIFVAFVLTAFTGIALWLFIPHQPVNSSLGLIHHRWLVIHICCGLTSVAGSFVHVIWHRDWLKALRRRPMTSLPAKLRANRVVDRFIWMIFLAASGFGTLDWILSIGENRMSISSHLHVAFGIAWLLGIAVHLVLHKKWIISASMRYLRVKEAYGAHFSGNS